MTPGPNYNGNMGTPGPHVHAICHDNRDPSVIIHPPLYYRMALDLTVHLFIDD